MIKDHNGFSLLEIIMAVTCLLILASIAVPNWLRTTWPMYRLRGAARQMVADIRHVKMDAVTSNTTYRIVLSVKTNSYAIEKSVVIGSVQQWVADNASWHVGAGSPGCLPKGIQMLSASVETLIVKPTGRISATTIVLKNSNADKIQITCSMAGRIRLERST